MIVPVRVVYGKASLLTYALLDSGATGSAISWKLVEKLNVTVKTQNMTISTYGYKGTAPRSLVNVCVEPLDGSFSIDLKNTLVGDILTTEGDRPPTQIDIEDSPEWEGVVHFNELDEAHMGLVISARHAWTWVSGERLTSGRNELIAVNTAFGWSLIGPRNDDESDCVEINCCVVQPDNESLNHKLDRILKHDFIAREGEKDSPEVVHLSKDDLRAVKQMENTIVFDKELGHYRCGVPWADDCDSAARRLSKLDSAPNAINRLRKSAVRMRLEPDRKAGAFKQMQGIIDDKHCRRVTDQTVQDGQPVFHIPIHIDTKKPGKFRVCQDAAARVEGTCLNDLLLSGPDLTNRIVGVLLRFRRHMVAIGSDIRGFFHQIYLLENEVPAFRFYWWEDDTMRKIVLYEMLVHIFGAKSSPAVATFVLRFHAKLVAKDYDPEVLFAILWAFYVDDLLASYPTVEKARRIRLQLQEALQRGGF